MGRIAYLTTDLSAPCGQGALERKALSRGITTGGFFSFFSYIP